VREVFAEKPEGEEAEEEKAKIFKKKKEKAKKYGGKNGNSTGKLGYFYRVLSDQMPDVIL